MNDMNTLTKTHYDFQTVVFSRVARAASVLLSDPCFQLHSIQHLLGEGEASPAGTDRKHFSLHACEYTSTLWLFRVIQSQVDYTAGNTLCMGQSGTHRVKKVKIKGEMNKN